MNVLIIGNISTGKTRIAEALISKGFALKSNYHSIDNMRIEYSDGTMAGEFYAWANMLEVIQHPADGANNLYEFSGTGKNAWFVNECMEYAQIEHKANWLVLYCLCEKQELLNRIKDRVYTVPIPYKGLTPQKTLGYMSSELQKIYNKDFWCAPELTVNTTSATAEECADQIINHLK